MKYRVYDDNSQVRGEYKTFEEAVVWMGKFSKENPERFFQVKEKEEPIDTNNLPDHLLALCKLETITEALNEGWKPDWNNEGQKKWYIRYNRKKGELILEYSNVIQETLSGLYFKSRELANYASKQFVNLYKQLLKVE